MPNAAPIADPRDRESASRDTTRKFGPGLTTAASQIRVAPTMMARGTHGGFLFNAGQPRAQGTIRRPGEFARPHPVQFAAIWLWDGTRNKPAPCRAFGAR